jgi:membrane protease YdiL (CAAX protease family)
MTVSNLQKAALGYQAAMVIIEIIALFGGVFPGGILHILLFLVLLNHYRSISDEPHALILVGLAFISLLRVSSLVLSFPDISPLFWYALSVLPLFGAVGLLFYQQGVQIARLGRPQGAGLPHLLMAGAGLPLSVIAYFVVRPAVPQGFGLLETGIAAIGIFLMAGCMEEIIFRGVLQQAAVGLYGRMGIWWCNALFTVMYIGFRSLEALIFFHIVGLLFAWWSERTGSIWAIMIAHGVMMVGVLIVFPYLWG